MSKIIAANWKMNKLQAEAQATAKDLAAAISANVVPQDRTIIVFPPFLAVPVVAKEFLKLPNTLVGAQNFYPKASGAYTGEVSLAMLKEVGASWVLVGHSERRQVLKEDDALLAAKTRFALEQDFGVMLCIGETLAEREAGQLKAVLSRQLEAALAPVLELGAEILARKLIIAYEPVWAIGTGKVAGQEEVLEAHALVKELLGAQSFLPVLYGGSVKPDNAGLLLGLKHVDGLLVGGASLEAQSFLKIVKA